MKNYIHCQGYDFLIHPVTSLWHMRFSQTGRPVIRVAKELSDNVRLVRANFEANLISYTGSVMNDNTEAYKAQLEQSNKAGAPIALQFDFP